MITKIDLFCRYLERMGEEAMKITNEDLNCGGCAVYASMVVNAALRASLPAFGIVATYEGDSLIDQRPDDPESVDAWNDNGVQFNHVGFLIRCNKKISIIGDSNNVSNSSNTNDLSGWPIIPGVMNFRELHGITRFAHDWNTIFDRGCIPDLQSLVNSFMHPSKINRYR